jgi:membrane-associated phospholipid phosphatase
MAHGAAPPPATAQVFDPGEPVFWVLSGTAFLAALYLDEELRRDDPTRQDGPAAALAATGYFVGSRRFIVPAAVSATALTHLTGWPTERSRVVRVILGMASAGVAVEVVKNTVGRGRPRDVDDPYRFRPFARDNAWLSFPSGHAAAGFAMAGALDQEFDLRGFEVALYGLAGVIAWSRVYDDAHWTSDTVAGAIMGVAASRATVGWLQRRDGGVVPGVGLEPRSGAPMIVVAIPTR